MAGFEAFHRHSSFAALARAVQCDSAMKSHFLAIATCCAVALTCACSSQKHVEEPGPAEKAGAAVDEGAEDAKESAKEAGHDVGEATEDAGDKIKEKTND